MAETIAVIGTIIKALFTAGSVTGFVVRAVISVGLSVLSQSLRKKPKASSGTAGDLTFMVRQSAFPRRIPYGPGRYGGIWFYANTTGNRNEKLHLVLGIGEGPIEAVDEIWFGDELVEIDADGNAVGKYAGHARIKIHLGDQLTADETLVANDSNWTENHKLLGIAYAYLELTSDEEIYDGGLPEISFTVRGRNDIYDSRDASTGYSTNVALCMKHYMKLPKLGMGASDSEIDDTYHQTAANDCDDNIDLNAGGTEKRYALGGVVSMDTNPEDIVNEFVGAMAGNLVYVGGKFRMYAGVYRTPTFEITQDMIVGPVFHSNRLPKRDRINLVRGLFRSADSRWQPTDFPAYRAGDIYVDADGEELPQDLDLNMTVSGATAQRLAKIELVQTRFEKRIDIPCNLRAYPVQAGENVMLTLPRYGYESKHFEVIETKLTSDDNGAPNLLISLRETSSTIYDWDESTEEQAINIPADISVDGSGLTLTADPAPPGPMTKIARFLGDGNYLSIADDTDFDFVTGDLTLTTWLKFRDTSAQNNNAALIGQLEASEAAGTSVGIRGSDGSGVRDIRAVARDNLGNTYDIGVSTTPPTGEWIFVMVRVNGTTLSLYAKGENGTYIESNSTVLTSAIDNGSSDWTVGANADGTADIAADVGPSGVWSDNLADTERDSLYNSGIAKLYASMSGDELTALESFWNLDEGFGGRYDSVGDNDLAETGGCVISARGQDTEYPLDVLLEVNDPNATIKYSTTSIDTPLTLAPDDGIVAVDSGDDFSAQAFAEGIQSNLIQGVYNYQVGDLSAATLEAHFAADIGICVESGKVVKWYDQSGNDRHAEQSTSDARPTFNSDDVNGLPSLSFDGVDDFLQFAQPFAGTTYRTLFLVLSAPGISAHDYDDNIVFDLQDGNPAAGGGWSISYRTDLSVNAATPYTSGYQYFNTNLVASRWFVVQVQWYGAYIQTETDVLVNRYVYGALDQASVLINTASTTYSLIGKTNMFSGKFYTGKLAEIALWNGLMTKAERYRLHTYFQTKYNITT